MPFLTNTKYKINIDPKSKHTQGLQEGDIVRRQYMDSKNLIYTLMVVMSTGVEKVVDDEGVSRDSSYFIGMLLDGDAPQSGQVLDFVRMTNLFDSDRSGALYMTASDSGAPYMSVIDKLGTERSMLLPHYYGTDLGAVKNAYQADLKSVASVSYSNYTDGAYRVLRLTKTSASTSNPSIKGVFTDTLVPGEQMMVSLKIRASVAGEVTISTYQSSGSNTQSKTVPVTTDWTYVCLLYSCAENAIDTRTVSITMPSGVSANSWMEVGELNVIKLSDVSSFIDAEKSRLGRIDGIVDPTFGTLRGYGLYSKNLYATGDVSVAGTLTAGDENGSASTFYAGKIKKNVLRNSLSPNVSNMAVTTDIKSPTGVGQILKITKGASTPILTCREAAWATKHLHKLFIFSVWVYGYETSTVTITAKDQGEASVFDIDPGWNRCSMTFELVNASTDIAILFSSTYSIAITSPQLEIGDHATLYQPTDAVLADESNEAYGMWACRGGIGGTIQNPLLSLESDGSLRSRDGNFYILADGSAYFKGTVEIGDKSKLNGTTIIKDGQIDTTLINAKEIYTTYIETETAVGAYLKFEKGKIGGWLIESDKLTSETTAGKDHIEIGSDGYIRSVVAQAEKWRLSADGSGMLASGAISWTTAGDLTVNKITATSGTIAGWNIDKNYLYVGTKQTGNAYTTGGITIFANGSSAAIRAKNFRIDTDGSAYFKGTVNATAGSFGNWHIDGNYIYSGAKQESDAYSTSGITFYAATVNGVEKAALRSVNFRIDTDGSAYFKGNGEFAGTITANDGSIGGWSIGSDNIHGGSTYLNKAGDIYNEKDSTIYWKLANDGSGTLAQGNIAWTKNGELTVNAGGTFKGTLSAATGSFSGSVTATSGTIGGWTINKDSISSNNITISSTGFVECTTKDESNRDVSRWKLNKDGSGYLASGNISWDAEGGFDINNGYIGAFYVTKKGDTIESEMDGSLIAYYAISSDGSSTPYDNITNMVNDGVALTSMYRTIYRAAGGYAVQQCFKKENGTYYFRNITSSSPNGDARFGDNMSFFFADGSAHIGPGGNVIQIQSDGSARIGTSGNYITIDKNGKVTFQDTVAEGDTEGGKLSDMYLPKSGGTMTGGQIARAGSSQSWVNGRKGAMIRLTTAGVSQYMPIWSVKSQEGSWDCGTYTSNRLHFSYITDANFTAGTNTQTANIYFNTNGTITAGLNGNATTATTLQTARTINGTSFNGSSNITTANWGTARNIYIADSSGTNTGAAVSVNGSGNATLKLPATIKASLTGNASTATTLQTARTLWGQTFNGSANVSGNMTGVGSITASGAIKTSADIIAYSTGSGDITLPIASSSALGAIKVGSGLSIASDGTLSATGTGSLGSVVVDGTGNAITTASASGTTLTLTKGNSFLPLSGGTLTGALTATKFTSNIANGTAPIAVTSKTLCTNLNADLLDGYHITSVMSARRGNNSQDLNEISIPSIWRLSTSDPNLPSSIFNYGNLLHIMAPGADTAWQLIGAYSSNELWFRRGTWYSDGTGTLRTNAWKKIAFTDSNVASATKLQTARTINGTSFDGTGNITTSNWGTARNISIADSDGTNTGAAVSVNGSGNATLKLPASIKASLTGNASTATTLQTARTLWGQTFNGSKNVSGNMTGVGSITASGTIKTSADIIAYSTGSGDITLPIASASALGAIKVGSGLAITSDGTLSATGAGSIGSVTVNGSGNAITAASASGTILTLTKGTTFWHAGNDGSGSGLDADLLDGLQATAFARADQAPATDLNDVNGKGIMGNPANANATTERNYPIAEAGVLFYGTAAYYSANQIYGSYNSNRWFARGGGGSTTAKTAWKEFAFKTDNVASATKLQTSRLINGTYFNGTDDITTANWGTARNISIADSDGTNTGTAVSVNGGANATLKLPATIKAALSGNATTATTLQTARTLWGQTFNGSKNVSGDMTGVGSITASGVIKTSSDVIAYSTGTTTAPFKYWYPSVDDSGNISWVDSVSTTQPKAKNIRGPRGLAGTITNASASIDSNTGTPKVSVSLGGTESARTFSFAFQNLKGATGASISKVELSGNYNSASEGTNTYNVYVGSNNVGSFKVTNGAKGATGDASSLITTMQKGVTDRTIVIPKKYPASKNLGAFGGRPADAWQYFFISSLTEAAIGWIKEDGSSNMTVFKANRSGSTINCTATNGAFINGSDARRKKIISKCNITINDIISINNYHFRWKDEDDSAPIKCGVLAQDLLANEELKPFVTTTSDENGSEFYGVNYGGLGVAIAVGGIKELHALVKSQQAKIDELEKRLAALESK